MDNTIESEEHINRVPPHITRVIIYVSILLLVGMLCYLSYIVGSAKVCKNLDGFLDSNLKCHIQNNKDKYGVNQVDSIDTNNFQFNISPIRIHTQ